ncbi:glucosaminidase domain-containing protein [Arachidicoccus terrestris]|uniref:glucosaminidase domain-containing protein n=1 Tax=Arachidicoccus terrestris TaxID=2875539 RepID=UPI001CC50B46|nr:glucosaminidase domain-containing protein [Arachidicoccus terrestris]UAY54789.1 hypothetical protein K9M52_15275 [Arachidicoccus terrestris]
MSIEKTIYDAALPRLKRHFSDSQSKRLASFMVAQSRYESANYTSHVFKANNNAFGYKYYGASDYQLGQGIISNEGNPYADYSTIDNSAEEVADWLGRRQSDFENVNTLLGYAEALKKNDYYGETAVQYAAGLAVYKYSSGLTTVALFPLLLVGGYLLFKR